jgi:biotin operon repressor
LNETLDIDQETLAVIRSSLPASQEELATTLDVASSRVPGVIRKLRQSGYVVKKDKGIYRGASQLEEYELAVMEHRDIANLATRAATAAMQFPTPGRAEAARLYAEELERLDAEIGKQRRARTLQGRIARYQQELEALSVS